MPNWPTEPGPGNQTWIFLNYYVYCRTQADVQALRDQFQDYGVPRRPAFIRDTLGIPETAFGFQIDDEPRAISFPYPPYTVDRSVVDGAWQAPRPAQGLLVYPSGGGHAGDPYWWPPLSVTIDYNQDWFEIPAHPAVPVWGAGRGHIVVWSCTFLSMGGHDSTPPGEVPPPELQPITKRRFLCGFELYNQSSGVGFFRSPEGFSGNVAFAISRDASRTPDGMGFAIRSLTSIVGDNVLSFQGAVTNAYKSWERIYGRIRRLPTVGAANGVCVLTYFDSGSVGSTQLRITSTGQIQIWNSIFPAAATLTASSGGTLPVGAWRKIDVLLRYFVADLGGGLGQQRVSVSVYVAGSLFVSGTADIRNSAALPFATATHLQSRVGNGATGANDLEIDWDDWSNQEHPSGVDDTPDFTRMDWIFGTHIQALRPIALNLGTNWAGDFRTAGQLSPLSAGATFTSSTALARLKIDTEFDDDPLGILIAVMQQGIAAFQGSSCAFNAGAAAFSGIGYDSTLTGEVINQAQVQLNGGIDSQSALANTAAGSLLPPATGPIAAIFRHENSGALNTVKQIMGLAQFLGSYGPEDDDDPDAPGITDVLGIHNAPYFNSFMARETPPPVNTVSVAAGTYAGNNGVGPTGPGQDIIIELPAVHFLYLRRVDTVAGRATWWTSCIDIHNTAQGGQAFSEMGIKIVTNDDGTCTLTISGQATNNSLGTYQYIAFCDISSRVLLNGAFAHQDGTNVNSLFLPTFTPELAFFCGESMTSGAIGTGIYMKGPGHTSSNATSLEGTSQTNNIATFAAGSISSLSGLNSVLFCQVAFMAWRSTDGDITPNPVFIGQYTGNGAGGTRVLSVDLGGRRPLFAIVQSVTGGVTPAYERDPGHAAGGHSSTVQNNSDSTTAIVGGGIDEIHVGITLNVNLAVYNVFIIPGSSTECVGNDGWSCQRTYGLNIPGWDPTDFPPEYLTPPAIPADISVLGEGGLVLSGSPGLLMIKDLSGIYTIVPGKTDDTVYDRQSGQTSVDMKIPDPIVKIGYVP